MLHACLVSKAGATLTAQFQDIDEVLRRASLELSGASNQSKNNKNLEKRHPEWMVREERPSS